MSFRNNDCRIYVGNLPPDIRSKELDDLFYKFGKIRSIDIKDGRLPPFAFIEFDDPRDAEDAVYSRDGYDFDGYRLRVEFPRGSSLWRRASPRRRRTPPRPRRSPPRRSKYGVKVSGLPASGSWQDLKDHMKEAGEVCYADVYRDGTGVVEFLHYDDMKYAVKHLDDTKFRSHENETSYIRVKQAYRESRSRSRSYSRSRSHSKRKSYTKSKSKSRSRSKTRSKSRSKERSASKSRSKSPDRSHSSEEKSPKGSRTPSN